LKERLDSPQLRLHHFSEGEVLHSWKHLQIKGIGELRVRFMNCFVAHMRDMLSHDENAVFLLNRFHLSTYVSTVAKDRRFEAEYDDVINVLKQLPVHVFILQLSEHEMEERSLHPERSGAWRAHQRQITKKEGFQHRLDRYIWQQSLMIETAKKQALPYSLVHLSSTDESFTSVQPSAERIFSPTNSWHRSESLGILCLMVSPSILQPQVFAHEKRTLCLFE
jgi:hypothetical protein